MQVSSSKAARCEKRGWPVLRLQSRAWSFTCLTRFARWTKKKERLLVVYSLFPIKWGQQEHDGHYYQSDNLIWGKQRRRQSFSCSPFDLSALSSPAKPWLDWLKRDSCREYDAERSSYMHEWLALLSLPIVLQWLIVFVDQEWITSLWASCGSYWPCID